jgi:hypothetical protein
MGFVPLPKTTESPFDLECASMLAEVVKNHNKVMRPIYPKVWARDFAKLRNIDNVPKCRILRILNWYILHFGEKYISQAYSAKSFRSKFDAIERQQARHQEKNPTANISDEAKEIAQDCLVGVGWPAGAKQQLPLVIQLSLDNYKNFRKAHSAYGKKLAKLPMNLSKNTTALRFWENIGADLGYAKSFITRWFTSWIHKRRANWNEWDGNLVRDIFSKDHPVFLEWGRKQSSDFSGSVNYWNTYMEKVNAYY